MVFEKFANPWPLHGFLSALALSCILFFGNPVETQEKQWFDQCLGWRFASGFAKAVDNRILHLDITDSDLASLPTPESEYQAASWLIREAMDLGAELIVFDVIYGRGSPEMAQPILEAIPKNRRVVWAEGLNASPGSLIRDKRIRSFPFLQTPLSPAGLINIQADSDGVYRHYPFIHSGPKGPEPSLALTAYLTLKGIRWPEDVTLLGPDVILWKELSKDGTKLEPKKLVQDALHPPLLDFRSSWTSGSRAAFGHLTLSKLHELHLESGRTAREKPLAGKPPVSLLSSSPSARALGPLAAEPPVSLLSSSPSARALGPLAGKILFVSYVVSGVSDFGATPFGPHQPLVQLHSTALNDLLQNSFHRRVPRWMDALMLASVLLMGCGAAVCRTKRGLAVFWLAAVCGILLTGMGLVFKTRWVLPSVAATCVWTIAFVAELVRRHSRELIERLKMRTTMGYYFSPRVIERVLANPGSMEPQQVELTVLLTDLRNFTPMSERLGTRGVFALCNQVFEVETAAAMAEEGSLEHFLGDQFLSYWGAPDPQPDGADRALRAALRLIRDMEQLRPRLPDEIKDLFGYGVALHSGLAMIGNKGSAQRLDYGVMGDLINSAARVESLTKYYGIPFLMTRETHHKLQNPPFFRYIDTVLPVGKSTPFELLEIRNPLTPPHFEEAAQKYHAAFGEYRQGNFARAREAFRDLVRLYQDNPSRLLAHRCEEFMAHSPEKWEGIYQFTSK